MIGKDLLNNAIIQRCTCPHTCPHNSSFQLLRDSLERMDFQDRGFGNLAVISNAGVEGSNPFPGSTHARPSARRTIARRQGVSTNRHTAHAATIMAAAVSAMIAGAGSPPSRVLKRT